MKDNINIEDLAFLISEFATEAMLYEVSCYPSAGLVSPISNGSHKDMNYFTFLSSTAGLSKYMIMFAKEGYSSKEPKEIFQGLRVKGLVAEKYMFEKTNGINTHKGMIFLMGICCGAVAKAFYERESFVYIRKLIRDMTEGIVRNELQGMKGFYEYSNKEENLQNSFLQDNYDLKNNDKALTYGEKLYVKYGVKGIRGEVESGMPIVFDYALPLYRQCGNLEENHRLVHTLIGIMQYCEDTTILHRHSIEQLFQMQNRAKEIMNLGGMTSKTGREAIQKLEKEFIGKRISPGGCADLLAVTVFFNLVKESNLFIP